MPRPLDGLLRLVTLTAAGLCFAAVLLGRHAPSTRGDPPAEDRTSAVPRFHGVSDLGLARARSAPRVLDVEIGTTALCTIPDPALIGVLGCSPWRDREGQFHLIARTVDTASDPRGFPLGTFALARCTYPAGRILGRVALERMPIGPVCLSPDRGDRILFASGDGRLYRHDFPPGGWSGIPSASPRPIRWGCGLPGADAVFLQEPCWPAGPYPGGWLLATVRVRVDTFRPLLDPRAWWLKLDPEGGAIVEARRAIADAGESLADAHHEEYLPTVGPGCDGPRRLAYLVRRGVRRELELRITPLAPGATDGGPRAVPPGRVLVKGCLAMAPAFSTDGRWVYAAMPDEGQGVRIVRFAASPPEHDRSGPVLGE